MPFCGVDDLVADHVGEFVLAVGERQQAARDEDVTTGQRKCVRLELIDDLELIVEAHARHTAKQPLPELVDVVFHLGVFVESHLGGNNFRGLPADADIIGFGEEDVPLPALAGLGSARARYEDDPHREGEASRSW